jgi:hypothetical protein
LPLDKHWPIRESGMAQLMIRKNLYLCQKQNKTKAFAVLKK